MKTQLLLITFVCLTVSAFAEESTKEKAERLFNSLNKPDAAGALDDYLSVDELAPYVLSNNADWKNAEFQNLPGYRELALKTARLKAADDFVFYSNNADDVLRIRLAEFIKYLADNDPKFKAPPRPALPGLPPASPPRFTKSTQFHLKRSSTSVKEEKLPAQLSWTGSRGNKPQYAIDAALSYSIDLGTDLLGMPFSSVEFAPTAEAHISSGSAASQDSLSIKPKLSVLTQTHEDRFFTSHYWSLSPVYERDYKKTTETLGGELLYSPNSSALSIGRFIPLSSKADAYPGFMWRPYIGWQAGHAYRSNSDAFEAQNTYSRLMGKLHAELLLAQQFTLAVDYFHYKFFSGDHPSFDYVEVSPIYYLGEVTEKTSSVSSTFSVGLTYKNGESAPKFEKTDALTFWLGVQF